jgi:hypothetical protein
MIFVRRRRRFMLMSGGGPVALWLASPLALPPFLSVSRTSNATLVDSTGAVSFAPNNFAFYSQDFSQWTTSNSSVSTGVADPFGGTQAATVTATAGFGHVIRTAGAVTGTNAIMSVWIRRRTGSGTISVWNAAGGTVNITGQVSGSWARAFVAPTVVAGGSAHAFLQLATNGDAVDVYGWQTEAVTYQTTPSAYNATGISQYFGPRLDYRIPPAGLLVESSRTNIFVSSHTPATQTITVVNGTTYTVSFYGTGSITTSGANAQTISGTGATVLTTATFAASSTSLTCTLSGSVTNPQVEAGSFATSRIITDAAGTRAADAVSATMFSANPAIIQTRSVSSGTRSRTRLSALSDISSQSNVLIEAVAVYPLGTPTAFLDARLTVDGPY